MSEVAVFTLATGRRVPGCRMAALSARTTGSLRPTRQAATKFTNSISPAGSRARSAVRKPAASKPGGVRMLISAVAAVRSPAIETRVGPGWSNRAWLASGPEQLEHLLPAAGGQLGGLGHRVGRVRGWHSTR